MRNAQLVSEVEKEIEQNALRKRETKQYSRADLRRKKKAARACHWESGDLSVKIFLDRTALQENCEREATDRTENPED